MGHDAWLFAVNDDGTKTELCYWRSKRGIKRGIHAAMAVLSMFDDPVGDEECQVWVRDLDGVYEETW